MPAVDRTGAQKYESLDSRTLKRAARVVLRALVLGVALSAGILAGPAGAQIADAQGPALGSVRYECTPCCFVQNLSGRRVRASILTPEALVTEEIQPGATQTFSRSGECVRGGYLLRVDFIK